MSSNATTERVNLGERFLARLCAVLSRGLCLRHARWVIVGVALLLFSPSLFTGLGIDDRFHELMLRDPPGLHGLTYRPFDLFAFATGSPEAAHELMDEGVFPWWADPHVVLSFFRPLSSATHYLDYVLWPTHPFFMHVHSLFWLALLLFAVGKLYTRVGPTPWIATLALLLYSVDDARAPVAGWVANRNAIVALTLALPALLAHDGWRRQGLRSAAFAGPIFFAAGLCAGETALVVLAYLFAYALFLDETGPWWQRLLRLAPYAIVALLWRAAYERLGYGCAGSGLYADPGRDPAGFAVAAASRMPVLLLGQFAGPWSDFWDIYPLIAPPATRYAVMTLALCVTGALAVVFAPLWKREREIRFWSVGCVLATLPMCATFPHDRLLLGTGIGGMALIARLVTAIGERTYPGATPLVSLSAASLAVIHLLVAPMLAPLRSRGMNDINSLLMRADATIPSTPDVARQSVVVINPPLDPFAAYFQVYREAARRLRPRAFRWLATGVTALSIQRVDERTLRIRPDVGFLSSPSQRMLRSLDRPLALGEKVVLSDATVEVTEVTADARPQEVLVRFHVPLEDPSLRWFEWGTHGYVPFVPPPVGETVVIPAVDMRRAILE